MLGRDRFVPVPLKSLFTGKIRDYVHCPPEWEAGSKRVQMASALVPPTPPIMATFLGSSMLWVLFLGPVFTTSQVLKVNTWRFGEGAHRREMAGEAVGEERGLEVGKDIETLGNEVGEQPVKEMDVDWAGERSTWRDWRDKA